MKSLVTGGAGFIGSNLAAALADTEEVVILDNVGGKFSLGRMENVNKIRHKIKFINGDIRSLETVLSAAEGCDVIFNQAAASSSPMFHEDVHTACETNTKGFINILEAARKNDAAVVYASTSSVYGNNPVPLKEEQEVKPPNIYAATKLFNEHMAKLFNELYGLRTAGLRYMSIYGSSEEGKGRFANMATQFLRQMQAGQQPVIYGDGSQRRDFTFVDDVVKANLLAAGHGAGGVFNVGTGKSTSLTELADIINKILGTSIRPTFIENKVKNYIMDQRADLTNARKIGYEPTYTLEEGLREVLRRDKTNSKSQKE